MTSVDKFKVMSETEKRAVILSLYRENRTETGDVREEKKEEVFGLIGIWLQMHSVISSCAICTHTMATWEGEDFPRFCDQCGNPLPERATD